MRQVTQDMGQTAGPEEAYLALRGLRTMDIRLRQHGQSALRAARWLQEQEEVEHGVGHG